MLLACLPAAGCSGLRYYAHVAHGEVALLARREPLDRAVDDRRLPDDVRARLRGARDARRFASEHLALPANASYSTYVQLDRPYVSWSVFAAPEFSVEPVTHCFPFAGCVAYRGYFDRGLAEREAARLAALGNDTSVRGVAAFSTLGWFADPIVSSMLRGGDDALAGTIFHELAHQQVYLAGDTAFNESYASFVEQQGLREWRAARGLAPSARAASRQEQAFLRLVLDLREQLKTLYASPIGPQRMREAKRARIEAFRARYAREREALFGADPGYDAWVAAPINNASLVPFGLYDRWTGAFGRLFAESGEDWRRYHAAVEALAHLAAVPRAARLQALSSP
jgi:predicted aminopeptidase